MINLIMLYIKNIYIPVDQLIYGNDNKTCFIIKYNHLDIDINKSYIMVYYRETYTIPLECFKKYNYRHLKGSVIDVPKHILNYGYIGDKFIPNKYEYSFNK